MNTQNKRRLCLTLGQLSAFLLWTVPVRLIDVRPVGPLDSAVGFAALNQAVHGLTGVHLSLYTATDLLSLVPLGFVLGFAGLGLAQWVRRRSLRRVDRSLIVLGGFYLVMLAGVHWLTDIVGGILLSAGLAELYATVSGAETP